MNRENFTQPLINSAFTEVLEKSLPADDHNAAHSHPFDVRALVTQGDITLSIDGVPTQYREGEIFTMVAGCTHAENVGPSGVTYLVGRRYANQA